MVGLELGADDYVVKPFSPRELVARVKSVLRRASADPRQDAGGTLWFDGVAINPLTRTVNVNGAAVQLTAKEFDLLFHLALHRGQVFTRSQLMGPGLGLRVRRRSQHRHGPHKAVAGESRKRPGAAPVDQDGLGRRLQVRGVTRWRRSIVEPWSRGWC